ncbi:MAG: hypothetical protein K8S55_03630 [Phycisphaerae bacterium]|nr:hypothetical protein [Phycisphaerae bacterium]
MSSKHINQGAYLPVSEYLEALAGPDPEPSSVMAEAIRMACSVVAIVDDYDVRSMTPPDMIEMAKRLYLVGAIGMAEYAVLSFKPNLYPHFDASDPIYQAMQQYPKRRRDYIAEWWGVLNACRAKHIVGERNAFVCKIIELLESFQPLDDE